MYSCSVNCKSSLRRLSLSSSSASPDMDTIVSSCGDAPRGALGAYATVLNEVGTCATGERSGTAEGDRVPSCSAVLNNLLAVVEAAEPSATATDGVVDDLLARFLGVKGFSALCLAMVSSICRLTMSAVLSLAMLDAKDIETGVQGREGSFDCWVLNE